MLAPKVSRAPAKAADDPTRKLAPGASLLEPRSFAGAVEQLEAAIEERARLRHLRQRLSNLTAEAPAGRPGQSAAAESMTAAAGPGWDFSQIPVFPSDQVDQTHPSSPLAATPPPGAIQAKLAVGQPDDPLEREADRVADQVMRVPAPGAMAGAAPPQVSRKRDMGETASLQTKQAGRETAAGAAPGSVHETLRAPGQPLGAETRAYFEPRFGQDFSQVRIHADTQAEASARALRARAYTVGSDIVFGDGQYAPATSAGRRLLAHELTHVAQQRGGPGIIQRQPRKPDDKDPFDFMIGDVDHHPQVIEINAPTDTGEFLDAFTSKGTALLVAQAQWASNNLIDFTRDVVASEKRDPFANVKLDTVRQVAGKAYEKAVGALLVQGAKMAVTKVYRLVYIGQKVLYVGSKAGTFASRFGGLLAMIASAVVQAIIGPLFDKTKELVKQALDQFAKQIKEVENSVVLPEATKQGVKFGAFMNDLKTYMLADDDRPAKPKGGPATKDAGSTFAFGDGELGVQISVDRSKPMTDRREHEILLELANAVFAIDQVVPNLASDKSLYEAMATEAGVLSSKTVQGKAAPQGAGDAKSLDEPFQFKTLVDGKTTYEVPEHGGLNVTAEASYTEGGAPEGEDANRPATYTIALYKGRTQAADDEVVLHVGKRESGRWANLEKGTYHLVLSKGGSPQNTLSGSLSVQVTSPKDR